MADRKKTGRKQKYPDMYNLKPGERSEALKGRRLKYCYQYASQHSKRHPDQKIRARTIGEHVYFEGI